MTKYKTRPQDELIAYMKSMQGKHLTANEINDHFRNAGIAIGVTTIYRHLERMVEEGLANKYILDKTSPACFEYIGKEERCAQPVCYHCKCEKCGELIHLDCAELTHFQKHMLDEHGFELNPLRTIFYGICAQCRQTPA